MTRIPTCSTRLPDPPSFALFLAESGPDTLDLGEAVPDSYCGALPLGFSFGWNLENYSARFRPASASSPVFPPSKPR
jgi:hypothetical protein